MKIWYILNYRKSTSSNLVNLIAIDFTRLLREFTNDIEATGIKGLGEMNNIYSDDIRELIDIKLETTRAICNTIIDSNLTDLSGAAKLEFADIMELVAILMLEYAGEFPEEWTSEKLIDVYHFKLPTLLEPEERQNIKDIIMTYVAFVGEALELPNYMEIKKNLAS